ncbi:MAG: YbfB/YjiJ family MFS transporter [Gammaproteobacteria bacterium]
MNGLGIAFLLSLGTVVSNSFARFAYALMLPAMRNDLGWNWSQAGWLNTANAFGYLAGALLARALVDRVGNRALFIAGMPATALALLATGLVDDLLALSALRAIAGVAGAMVFVCGGALAGNVFPDDPRRATLAITVFFGGSGAGLVLCGAGIPLLLERGGDAAWPQAWLAMGAASLAMTVAAIAAARAIAEPAALASAGAPVWRPRDFAPALLAYTCFGLGYIGYMTFVIAWMREHGASTTDVILVWSLLGIATLVAPWLWKRPFAEWRGGPVIALVMTVLAAGAGLPLLASSLPAMLASAALFGAGMFSTPSAVSTLIRKQLPKPAWGGAMAVFTILFALGQIVGPAVTGWLADLYGSLRPGLALSVAVLLVGAVVALWQKDVASESRG